MFFISKKLRRCVRNKIMGDKHSITNELKIREEQLSEKEKMLDVLEKKYKYLELKAKWLIHNNGKKPLPGRFDEYDLIFCIGPTCHGTTMLKHFKLRTFSNPFDYSAGMRPNEWFERPDIYRDSRFHNKVQALCNHFHNWLNPKYFKYTSHFITETDIHHCITNTKTRIQYIHEFPIDKDIMQHMPEFIEKTKRRINNLYDAINKSDKILIVWLARIWNQTTLLDKNVSNKDIKWAVTQMKTLYPNKNFDFAFFEHDGTKKQFEYKKTEVIPGAYRIKSNHFLIDNEYNFVHPTLIEQNAPHVHVISEMLDNIRLSEKAFRLSYEPSDDPF